MPDLNPVQLFIVLSFFGLLGAAVATDLKALQIPNNISLSIALLYPAHVLASPAPVAWLPSVGLAVAVFVVGFLPFAFHWMGGGDVKLMAVTALWAGPASLLDFLCLTFLAGGAFALLMLAPSRFALAFACETVGAPRLRDALLGRSIPYALAIAVGAVWGIGPALFYGAH